MKCDDECLPTGMHADDSECPGSDDSNHHCVDCEGLWWDDKGNTCTGCSNYWCPDWQNIFYHSACAHLGDSYVDDEDSPIADDIENIQEGWCTQCVLASTLKCEVDGCKFSRKKILEKWIKFCMTPIVVEFAKLVRHHEDIEIKAKLYRKRPDPVEELWPIDMDKVELWINGIKKPGTLTWQQTIKEVKQLIKMHETEGFILKRKCFALRTRRSRDESPKRKLK